ncbi:hypothetical protein ONE63_008369 [Megalurothrips usitatus]|uniref:Ig-like domain-containing protein n=1 Tax=Megalurothrips usitatus TaxID=439358 RepID=A0AAV7XQ41_9NEOP|nr:hypothetical protein ONE63_008369 [Megalurothrips usitatus]
MPKDGPHITGGKPKYRVDEDVDVLCSVNRSKPAASLVWFINGEIVADEKLLRGPYKSVSIPDGLETAILGLHFKVSYGAPRHAVLPRRGGRCSPPDDDDDGLGRPQLNHFVIKSFHRVV